MIAPRAVARAAAAGEEDRENQKDRIGSCVHAARQILAVTTPILTSQLRCPKCSREYTHSLACSIVLARTERANSSDCK
jgi:hypothetical protein